MPFSVLLNGLVLMNYFILKLMQRLGHQLPSLSKSDSHTGKDSLGKTFSYKTMSVIVRRAWDLLEQTSKYTKPVSDAGVTQGGTVPGGLLLVDVNDVFHQQVPLKAVDPVSVQNHLMSTGRAAKPAP